MLVYLAGPIAACGRTEAARRNQVLALRLKLELNVTTFDPASAWHMAREKDVTWIQALDDMVVLAADAIIVQFTGDASVGTLHEITLAAAAQRPMLCLRSGGSDHEYRTWKNSLLRLLGTQPDGDPFVAEFTDPSKLIDFLAESALWPDIQIVIGIP